MSECGLMVSGRCLFVGYVIPRKPDDLSGSGCRTENDRLGPSLGFSGELGREAAFAGPFVIAMG